MPMQSDCLEEAVEFLDGISQNCLGEDVCAQIENLIVNTCLGLPGNSANSLMVSLHF